MIDTIVNDARKIAALIEPAFAVLAVVESALKIGGPSADAAVQVIEAALKSFAAVADGKVTADAALASLAALRSGVAANNAAADAALEARFQGGGV